MKVVWLTGDYTGKRKERQRQAAKSGCDIVIEFHFNAAADQSASGTEVWYRSYSIHSQKLAKSVHDHIVALGFKPRGVKAAVAGTRASFINAYAPNIWVVLLEPCFVTNPQEAQRLHDQAFMQRLAEAIIAGINKFLSEQKVKQVDVIGLSVGHKGKTSQPDDKGARCVFGDFEADHAEQLAKLVASRLGEKQSQTKGGAMSNGPAQKVQQEKGRLI